MKTASRILLSLSLVVFLAGMTFAQGASTASPSDTPAKQSATGPAKTVEANKSATCNHQMGKESCAQGKNFTDKNGDGICDNCGSAGKCKGAGCGQGQKNCVGCDKSHCKSNGSCDGKGKGNGCGKGNQNSSGCSHQGTSSTPETK